MFLSLYLSYTPIPERLIKANMASLWLCGTSLPLKAPFASYRDMNYHFRISRVRHNGPQVCFHWVRPHHKRHDCVFSSDLAHDT